MVLSKARRVGALMVATALVAGACGSSGGSAGSKGGGTSGAAVTLTMWNDVNTPTPGTPAAKFWFNEAIKMFEKANPNIHVKVVATPTAAATAFETLLKSSEVAGNTPDVGELYAGGQVTENGKYLLTLNKLLTPTYIKSLYDGWQFTTGGFKTGGPIEGVPYGAGYWYSVYYNKALFAKAHVKPLAPGASWTQLVALAKKVKAAGITPFTFGEKQGYFGAWTQDALISGEVGTDGVLQMNTGKLSLDSPAIENAYAAWHQLYADGLTNSDALSLDNTQGATQFAAGKGAMTITGGFSNQQFEQGLGKTKLGIFPVPALAGSKYTKSLSGGPNNVYVVFKNTKHAAQALKLVKFLVSAPIQVLALNGGFGQLPNNSSYVAGDSLTKLDPILAQTYNYIRVQHYPLFEAFDNIMPGSIDSYWYQTNTGVFGGSLSPTSAASSLESQMKQYLATQSQG
jgi:raffinose/stachyose/melibiose transport system substrate-binding protein